MTHRSPSQGPAITIVYEDDDLLVVDKPAGVLASTTPREPRPTLWQGVRQYLADEPSARPGLIHRLDREASGLLVFSKNDSAYRSLKAQFFKHSVRRVYTAVVSPAPQAPQGTIRSRLLERADGSVHSTKSPGSGQLAITHYSTIRLLPSAAKGQPSAAVLRVVLETGRKHQIRVHLSQRGWPIIGDATYGGLAHPAGLMLAATEFQLDHPRTGQRLTFQAPWPQRIREMVK